MDGITRILMALSTSRPEGADFGPIILALIHSPQPHPDSCADKHSEHYQSRDHDRPGDVVAAGRTAWPEHSQPRSLLPPANFMPRRFV